MWAAFISRGIRPNCLAVKITLEVQYPPQYPDVLPELSLHTIEGEGEIEDSEINDLLNDLRAVARALSRRSSADGLKNYLFRERRIWG